ncbi:MAG: response regulator [Methanomicrobiales archaeon]|nr:response regulator [Methanomicrobiales archaeon]
MNGRGSRPVEILLVEDNPADVRLTLEALKGAKTQTTIRIADDGVMALSMLFREGAYAAQPHPDLILLDLNLPKKDGREVLGEIKTNNSLKHIPIVVLTTSRAEEDVMRSYNLGVNCYVTKPPDLDRFLTVIKLIAEFWLTVVRLPRSE